MLGWGSVPRAEVLPVLAEGRANPQAEKPQVGRPILIFEPFRRSETRESDRRARRSVRSAVLVPAYWEHGTSRSRCLARVGLCIAHSAEARGGTSRPRQSLAHRSVSVFGDAMVTLGVKEMSGCIRPG